eukprot:g31882.t1
MSYRPDACDAALLAWANACLQHHSDEAAPTLEAVVDTNSLSLMCKKFNLGARRQSAAQRRRRVAEALNSCRVGLVEPSMAELGGPAAARSLTAGILLVAVEAPTKEEAIQFIVTLDQSQQAELAQVIQQLMDATGDKKDLVDEKAADLTPRISVRNRRFSDAEAHELRRTLDRHTQDVLEKQQVQLSMADKVAEAKALLCGEADRCVDLFQELDAKETEHRSLSRDLALKELSAQVEEERRRCRSIQMRQIDLKAEVDQAHHSVARVEASQLGAAIDETRRRGDAAETPRFSWQDGIEVHQDLQALESRTLHNGQFLQFRTFRTLTSLDLELREQPNLLKTDLCFRFMRKGRCSKGTSCTFAHGREELRVATQHEPERVNSEPMKVNLHRALEAPLEERALSVLDPAPLVGTCSKGTGCNFAHSDLELREQPNWTKTELCFRFMSKGRCGKGASCSFAHGRGELRGSTAAALPRAPERRKGLTEPMKVDIHRVSDQTTAWDTWTQLPFRPPPGLEPPPFIFSLSLTQRNTILTTWEESVSNSEGVLQEAESELDSCTQELKAMNSEDLDGLHVEIEKKSQALARAEQTTAETIAQRALIGQQIVEVGAVLQERDGAGREDLFTACHVSTADLATRKPRASLMLLGAPLADDALRWQKINEELVHTEVEVKTAESRSHHLGLELSEASEELTRCRMHEEAAKAEEEERQAWFSR